MKRIGYKHHWSEKLTDAQFTQSAICRDIHEHSDPTTEVGKVISVADYLSEELPLGNC